MNNPKQQIRERRLTPGEICAVAQVVVLTLEQRHRARRSRFYQIVLVSLYVLGALAGITGLLVVLGALG